MKYEPKKIIQDIDLACFRNHGYGGADYFVTGTSEAYSKLIPFFLNQIEMAEKFGSATKTIILKTPQQFRKPISDVPYKLNYVLEIKLKALLELPEDNHVKEEAQKLEVITTVEDIKAGIKTCERRQSDQMIGGHFLEFGNIQISSAPLGDWVGIE